MYQRSGVQCYRETDIRTMSQEKMIVLLYERVVADLSGAKAAGEAGRKAEATRLVNHSQRIVSELRAALDHAIGGEIAANLDGLYFYLFREHLQFLLDREVRHLENCLVVLEPLLTAWRKIPSGSGQREAESRARPDAVAGPDPAMPPLEAALPGRRPAEGALPAGVTSLLSVSA